MKKFKKDLIEVLKEGDYSKSSFRRAVEMAYMSEKIVKYTIANDVCFEQGAGRKVFVPIDIVEDVIGVELQLSRRVA